MSNPVVNPTPVSPVEPAIPVVVPTFTEIALMTKADLLKLQSDVSQGVSAIETAIDLYIEQEAEQAKEEFGANVKVFLGSPTFAAIHLSVSILALVGIGVLLIKSLL